MSENEKYTLPRVLEIVRTHAQALAHAGEALGANRETDPYQSLHEVGARALKAADELHAIENVKGVQAVKAKDAAGAWLAEDIPGVMPETILTEEDVEKIQQQGIRTVKANPAPISFEPVLKGIRTLPLTRRDWLSQMAFSHIKDAIKLGIPEGWKSDIHETNPIPGIIYGAEFGMGKFAGANGSPEELLARHLSDARDEMQVPA